MKKKTKHSSVGRTLVLGTKNHQFKSGCPDEIFNGYGARSLNEFIQYQVSKIRSNYENRNHGEYLSRKDKLCVKAIFCITWELLKRMYSKPV